MPCDIYTLRYQMRILFILFFDRGDLLSVCRDPGKYIYMTPNLLLYVQIRSRRPSLCCGFNMWLLSRWHRRFNKYRGIFTSAHIYVLHLSDALIWEQLTVNQHKGAQGGYSKAICFQLFLMVEHKPVTCGLRDGSASRSQTYRRPQRGSGRRVGWLDGF